MIKLKETSTKYRKINYRIFARFLLLLSSFAVLLCFSGCNLWSFTDMKGNNVNVKHASKIVDLWPEHASSFYLTGNADKLVGVSKADDLTITDWAKYFAGDSASNTPQSLGSDPDADAIKGLNADLVILDPAYVDENPNYAESLRSKGVAVADMRFSNFEEMKKSYSTIAEVVGGDYQNKINTYVKMLDSKVNSLQERITDFQSGLESDVDVLNIQSYVVHFIKANQKSLLYTNLKDSVTTECVLNTSNDSYTNYYSNSEYSRKVPANDFYFAGPQVAFVGGQFAHEQLNELYTQEISSNMSCVKNNTAYICPRGASSWLDETLEIYCMFDYMFWKTHPEPAQKLGITMDTIRTDVRNFYSEMCGSKGKNLTDAQIDYIIAGKNMNGT